MEHFEIFEEEFGEVKTPAAIPDKTYEKYKGILPDGLLAIWKKTGWGAFAEGLIWLTNPEDYEYIVNIWLDKTPFESIDHYHVIARDAFGNLYAWGQNNNQYFTISCPMHALIAQENKVCTKSDDPNRTLGVFFSCAEREEFDMNDEHREPLFLRAKQKLGSLSSDEVYGFILPLFAGGRILLDNLAIVKLDQYLTLLRQTGGTPKIPFAGWK